MIAVTPWPTVAGVRYPARAVWRWALALGGAVALLAAGPGAAGPQPARAAGQQLVAANADHFVPNTVEVDRGGTLQFLDSDTIGTLESPGHTLTELRSDGPRFDSGVVAPGRVGEVKGVSNLPAGTYVFSCLIHPFMRGTLIVH